MSRQHRGRVTVDPAGKAGLYQHQEMPGWTVVGVVKTATGTGALVRNNRSGIYCQANGGALRSLPQKKILAALANRRAK